MEFFTKEKLIAIIIIIVLILFMFFSFTKEEDNIEEDLLIEDDDNINKENVNCETEEKQYIMVHVCGMVRSPGLIILESESRVFDAIQKAGGLLEDANVDIINLAKKLTDEEKVYIPKIGEESEYTEVLEIESSNNKKLININTADKSELITLPGIGDKTAEKILDYRESNKFSNIEDIKNVSGIGDKKYLEIKDFIAVN